MRRKFVTGGRTATGKLFVYRNNGKYEQRRGAVGNGMLQVTRYVVRIFYHLSVYVKNIVFSSVVEDFKRRIVQQLSKLYKLFTAKSYY